MSFIKLKSTKGLNLGMFLKAMMYIRFLINARTKYNIHSPFVHSFIQDILDDKEIYYTYLSVEYLRKSLLKKNKTIQLTDLGAGSKYNKSNTISLKKLINKVQSSHQKSQLIFRIVNYFKPGKILEIGTSLGFTTSYISNANKKSKITTIEGDPTIANIAKSNFQILKLKNVEIINDNFDNVLETLLKQKYDLVFFDGNHSKEATLRYFNWAKDNSNENTIFIFDDIYWSKEMKQAWSIICKDPKVMLSIDIFSLGFIFFKSKNQKEHFNLIHNSNFF